MDLFDSLTDSNENLLPKDGIVNYYGPVMPAQAADNFLQELLENISWKNDEAIIMGKRIVTKRKVAWYGDRAFDYTYSKTSRQALPRTETLLELKARVEQAAN